MNDGQLGPAIEAGKNKVEKKLNFTSFTIISFNGHLLSTKDHAQ